ncbi:MAG: lytic transglycosylase domain-containing protein [Saprospiraceae bacterium]|nr:lytic transglycosylase domain-containing protein [Saprospiraceae bacterium]MBL0023599.1 lytic transglycosylase domain-containing protein [Saprospiraceae bacterium]
MMKYRSLFPVFGFVAGIIFTMLIFLSYSSESLVKTVKFFDLPQQIKSVNLDREFDFAGEPVPINEDTRERLDRELSVNAYWQSTTLLNLKMSNKHFPVVERILKENGIPEDFKYLAVAESGLRNLTSSASAKGYWQFMKVAAGEMGLEINDDVDERMHIEKSTLAAAKYIKQLYRRFGTWTNVAGAYNVGPTSFARTLNEQKENTYYDINVNDETSRYVFRVIAIKEIVKNPGDFGYYLEDQHKYTINANLKTIKITSTISDLAEFAHNNGTTYRLLKYYNPWLINKKLTVAPGKEYEIRIPG